MKVSARNFRNTNVRVPPGTDLQFKVWYRSPLSSVDHMLGATATYVEELIAWCGWGLGIARDWESEDYGGLWYSERGGGRCAECNRKQTEYEEGIR